jgi:putative transcriptional regulator
MTIKHHPSDATLAEYAAGSMDAGSRLVVGSHVAKCPQCRRLVEDFESVGGALLSELPPTPMQPDALANALSRLDDAPAKSGAEAPAHDDMPWLPEALLAREFGPWRWIGIGVEQRSIKVLGEDSARVFLLRAKPGVKLPVHVHTGIERTQVLAGAFIHDGGRFGAGDFDDAEGDIEHNPRVDIGETCICLVAMTGGIKMTGPIGRLIQPFLRL